MDFFLLDIFIVHPLLGYIIIFFGMFIEGDVILFAAAFLARLGLFEVLPLFLTSIAGMTIGDAFWYALGKYKKKFPAPLVAFFERVTAPFDAALGARLVRTLVFTKFAYGIHRLIVARAGSVRAPFSKFLRADALATVIWATAIMSLGYFGGFALEAFKNYFRFAEIGLLAGLVLLILLEKWLRKRALR